MIEGFRFSFGSCGGAVQHVAALAGRSFHLCGVLLQAYPGGRRSTQEQSAEYANINTRYLHKLESGRGHSSRIVLCRLKTALDCARNAQLAGLHVAKTSRFWGSRFEARLVIAGSSTAYRGKPLIFQEKIPYGVYSYVRPKESISRCHLLGQPRPFYQRCAHAMRSGL